MAKQSRAEGKDQPAEGADWPVGMPFTLYFPRRGGYDAADIEYAAPLPRVGDMVEYIDPGGAHRLYAVADVVHTLQSSPSAGVGGIPLLRAGIPAVYLSRTRRKAPRRAP
ncbi:MAG: hypothetical protein AABM41_02090 [Chloroflexota bacterium]